MIVAVVALMLYDAAYLCWGWITMAAKRPGLRYRKGCCHLKHQTRYIIIMMPLSFHLPYFSMHLNSNS